MKKTRIIALLLAVFLMAGLAGCQFGFKPSPKPTPEPSSDTSPEPSASPTTVSSAEPSAAPSSEPSAVPSPTSAPSNSPSAQTMDITVYYLKSGAQDIYLVREVHTLPKSDGVARAAMGELISGTPMTEGAYRVLPSDTKILGIKIDNGVATVDFSKEVLKANVGAAGEGLGISSIVNTLTEFPSIQKVSFTVEGSAEKGMEWWGHVGLYDQPFSRNIDMVYEPIIWVTSPAAGKKITSPVTLSGNALVFEATVSYRLKDADGNILAEGFTMAEAGAPARGDFKADITFVPSAAGKGVLEVFEVSMKDGSDTNKVSIPVTW